MSRPSAAAPPRRISFRAQSGAIAEADARALVDAALAVLALPALAPLFAAGSRAEVAIAGAAPRDGGPALPFVGRIDRLAVAADAVYLADYKTGARPPGANPPAYVAQLALYRAALAPLFPDRPDSRLPHLADRRRSDRDRRRGARRVRSPT